jgi:hypothetical protein
LLVTALSQAAVLRALESWPSSWAGIGAVIASMTREGLNVELRQFPEGWRANSTRLETPLDRRRLGLGADTRTCAAESRLGGSEQVLHRLKPAS